MTTMTTEKTTTEYSTGHTESRIPGNSAPGIFRFSRLVAEGTSSQPDTGGDAP